jgi:hypothetical protein
MTSPLRERFRQDLQLAGLAEPTQEAYVRAVVRLGLHLNKSPDRVTEEELRGYFLHLRNVRHVSRSTTTVALRDQVLHGEDAGTAVDGPEVPATAEREESQGAAFDRSYRFLMRRFAYSRPKRSKSFDATGRWRDGVERIDLSELLGDGLRKAMSFRVTGRSVRVDRRFFAYGRQFRRYQGVLSPVRAHADRSRMHQGTKELDSLMEHPSAVAAQATRALRGPPTEGARVSTAPSLGRPAVRSS